MFWPFKKKTDEDVLLLKVQKLTLQEGDIVLLSTPGAVSEAMIKHISASLVPLLKDKGAHGVILEEGMTITILSN